MEALGLDDLRSLALLLCPGKSEKGFNHTRLVTKLIQIGLIDEVNHQTLFGAVTQTGADHAPHLIH